MINVVGVRFQNTGKSYYFDPLEFELKRGMHVIVETQRGREFGTITIPPILVQDDKVVQPLRPILRIATQEDEQRNTENRERSKEAGKICVEKIAKYGLEMKLVDTEYTFDRSKLLFYFTADGRVDFRELVKELASVFRTRIELRQIGVRDETKIKGGLGMCGRELCCTTFLSDFAPVSIRMAKEQNLSLNPSKISGACGRLMCCLKNEQETYEYLNKQLPKNGQHVRTIDGYEGAVHSLNILKQTVKVMVDINGEKELREYAGGELAYGDRDFTCEPRASREDELDYFSEQLKIAVAAAEGSSDGRHASDTRRGSRNKNGRARSGQGGRGGQDGERRSGQDGERRRRDGDRQGTDQKTRGGRKQRGEKQETQSSAGTQQAAEGVCGRRDGNAGRGQGGTRNRQNQNERRRGAQNRQGGDRGRGQDQSEKDTQPSSVQQDGERRSGRNRQGGEKSAGRQYSRRRSGTRNEEAAAKGGEQNAAGGAPTESRDPQGKSARNRNRGRGGRKREGKQQTGDTAGTKQSDS